MKKYLFTLILFLALAGQGWAVDTWYVSTTGSGTTCLTGSPCSVNYGINTKAAAGDTVLFKDGTYSSYITWGASGAIIYVNRTGTVGNRITIKSENKWGALLSCPSVQSDRYGVGFNTNISYITIEDFAITNCKYPMYAYNNNDYLIYKGNKAYHNDVGMLIGENSDYGIIDGNLIYDINWRADGLGYGIYSGKNNNTITIINNIIYDNNGTSWYIHGGGGPPNYGSVYPTGTWTIANNTMYGVPASNGQKSFIRLYGNLSQLTEINIYNNIAYATTPSTALFDIGSNVTDSRYNIKNNLLYNTTYACGDNTSAHCTAATISGNITADPLFTNAVGGDFTLQTTSTAIEAGLDLSGTVDTDYAGTARPQNTLFDIGAYETLTKQCNDGEDNDSDGLIDLADSGCANSADNDEQNAIAPPNLEIVDSPRAVVLNQTLSLYYNLADEVGGTPTLDVKYDQTGSGCSGTLVATCDDIGIGRGVSCDVDTTGFAVGTYYFCGVTAGGDLAQDTLYWSSVLIYEVTAGSNRANVGLLKIN